MMEDGVDQGALTEADRDPKIEDERIEKEGEEARDQENGFAHDNAEIAAAIQSDAAQIDGATTNAEALDSARRELIAPENAITSDPAADPRMDRLEGMLEKVLAKTGEAPEADKNNNTKLYLSRFFGISIIAGAAVALVYTFLERKANNQPTDDLPPIPPEMKEKLGDLVAKWKKQPDAEFWESMAAFVEQTKPPLTAADQILFCNYTIQLCPSADPWIWDSSKDEMKIVDALAALYDGDTQGGTPVLYRNITKQTYQNNPLPRDIAASVLQLTLAEVFHQALSPN